MSQRVQYGDAGILEFPDELSRDEIAAIIKAKGPELTERFSKGRLASAGAEFARGAGESTGKSLPAITRALDIILEGPAALGWEPFLNPFSSRRNEIMTPEFQEQSEQLRETRPQRVAESPIAQAGETAAEYWREKFQPNPKYAQEFFAGTLPRAAGGTLPTIATAMIAGPAAAAVQYGAVAGEQAREEAISAGKPEVADRAFLTSAGLGAISEFSLGVPANIMRFIKRARQAGVAPEVAGEEVKRELGTRINEWLSKRPVRRALGEGIGREAAQESIEQVGQNWIASELAGYDVGRPLTQGVLEAAAAGGILGGLFGGGAAVVGRLSRQQQEEPSAIPVQSTATLPIRETPEDRQTLEPEVQVAEEPSRAVSQEEVQAPTQPDVAPVVFHSVFSPGVPGVAPVVYYKAVEPIQTSADKGTYDAGRNVTDTILTKSGFTIPPEERAKAEAEIARQQEQFEEESSPLPADTMVTITSRRAATGETIELEMPARTAERRLKKNINVLNQLLNCLQGAT